MHTTVAGQHPLLHVPSVSDVVICVFMSPCVCLHGIVRQCTRIVFLSKVWNNFDPSNHFQILIVVVETTQPWITVVMRVRSLCSLPLLIIFWERLRCAITDSSSTVVSQDAKCVLV